MKKQLMLSVSILGLAVLVIIGVMVFHKSDTPETYAAAKATISETSPHCLKSNDRLAVDNKDQSNIEMAALSHLHDVPAGTNVDVNIATYTGSETSGSALYPKNYGTYNFTAVKQSTSASNQITWKLTNFVACKP